MENKDLETLFIKNAEDPRPARNPTYLRYYGHHLCPYCEKVRIAFAAKRVPYQNVEVDLGKKTPWHMELSNGALPILEFPDGTTIADSKAMMEYLEDAYPDQGYSLYPKDLVQRAQMRAVAPLCDLLHQFTYKLIALKGLDEEHIRFGREDLLRKVEDYYIKHGSENTPYLFGSENPTMLDIHVFVGVTRFDFYDGSVFQEIWDNIKLNDFPRVVALIKAIRERPELQSAQEIGHITSKRLYQVYLVKLAATEKGHKVPFPVPIEDE